MDEVIWVYADQNAMPTITHAESMSEDLAARLAEYYADSIYFYAKLVTE